jgi:Zn-dependent M28 family amino/carboxypeptidase
VLFAAWNGTELGLLGSKHYVRNPVYPLQKTVAMIQLDMVGQGRGFYIIVSGDERQDAGILAQLERAAPQVEGRLTLGRYDGASDHHSFHQRGIPAVMLSWEKPEQVQAPGDSVELIDLQKLQTTGRVTALTLMAMADE